MATIGNKNIFYGFLLFASTTSVSVWAQNPEVCRVRRESIRKIGQVVKIADNGVLSPGNHGTFLIMCYRAIEAIRSFRFINHVLFRIQLTTFR